MARILIADDDPDILKTLIARLGSQGHEVVAAQDCNQAIKKAYATGPDLILMDIRMPVIGGLKASESLKMYSRTEKIPVIFITAYPGKEVEEEAMKRGAAAFIAKPFETEELLRKIDTVLKQKAFENQFADM
ncbi:MAG TPA: response regulator [bacterium]|nr:response regulator [bacterium]